MSVQYFEESYSIFSSTVQPTKEQREGILSKLKNNTALFLSPSLSCDIFASCFVRGEACERLPHGAVAAISAYMVKHRGLPLSSVSVEADNAKYSYDGIDLKTGEFSEKISYCKQIFANKPIKVRNCELYADIIQNEDLYAVIKTDDALTFDGDALSAVLSEIDIPVCACTALDKRGFLSSCRYVNRAPCDYRRLLASAALSLCTPHMYGKIGTLSSADETIHFAVNGGNVTLKAKADACIKSIDITSGYTSLV